MPDVPIEVDLSPGRVVGIVGDRVAALSLARALLLQMATHHGPADLAVVIGADTPSEWAWAQWLPHTADHAGGRPGVGVLHTHDVASATAALGSSGDRATVAVLDGHDPFQGRTTVGRQVLASERASAVVLVHDEHRLPAQCHTVVRTDMLGRIRVIDPRLADRGVAGLAWGVSGAVADRAARRLARLDDPELPIAGAGVPTEAPLLALLGMSGDDADEIESRWTRADGTADLRVAIGADGEGVVELDFVADGPHVLIGGTTGSGKSELLRSLVAGVAATADPDHVALVLIDYKGGAAFDRCADLPHVAGLVTDLDADLGARALRCLEAELRARERKLREVGADDMPTFRQASGSRDGSEPLPRLLVVIDEFASLAADLPDFLTALVGIAQRGRSLGVHLVLATQRPAGVVTDDIRANTGCRIALRTTDRHDSIDVIGVPDAADIRRDRPGRCVARFGPGETSPFQAALATGHTKGRVGVAVRSGPTREQPSGPTDLDRLVATILRAHAARGGARPRSPWPPALGSDLRRGAAGPLAAADWFVVDEPDEQLQRGDGWSLTDGHLVVVGGPGSGATTTLATAALAISRVDGPDAAHLHVIDLDSGALQALDGLPSAGTIVGPSDAVRRSRLLRWLDEEVARRRAGSSLSAPPLLLLVDDLGGLARAHDPIREPAIHDRFNRLWADGPAVGVTIAVSVRRSADLPPALAATAGEVFLHRTTDPSDGLRFGLKTSNERFPPGRAVRASDGLTVQVVRDAPTLVDAVQSRRDDAPPPTPPHEVGVLGTEIRWADGRPDVELTAEGASLCFAIGDRDLLPTPLRLHRGEHALVLGPPRSGRTTTLVTVAHAARGAVVVMGRELARRSGLVPTAPAELWSTLAGAGPTLVLIDDATEVEDPESDLRRLVASPPAGVHLVASARPDRYRSAYGHWTADIRGSRAGVLLRPEPVDGDLLGHQLPARLGLAPVAGRGILVADATAEVVQVVLPVDQSAS